MKYLFKHLLINCLILFIAYKSCGQIIKSYTADQLSGNSYGKFADSLQKQKNCPKLISDKKTQSDFEKSWQSRNEQLAKDLKNNDYVKDNVVLPYVQQIVDNIIAGNKTIIPYRFTVLLDRSSVANATSFGEHIISVNAGIILGSKCREELALYIAHEMAHDLLKHSQNSMKERAELLNSAEYKSAMNNVLSSQYDRYSRLMKVSESFSFDRTRHSRYSEQAADSFAIILVTNSNISFDASFFLNLDTMNNVYEWELKKSIREHLKDFKIAIDENLFVKKSKGLSLANHNFVDTSSKSDSLKTHPDCKLRYSHNLTRNSSTINKTPIPQNIHDAAFEIAIMNSFVNKNLTSCFYRLIQEKEVKPNLEIYDFLSNAIFHSLLLSVNNMERFNVLRIKKKKDVSTNYFELQNFLEQVSEKSLVELCNQMSTNYKPTDNEALNVLEYYKTLSSTPAEKKASYKSNFVTKFKNDYPNSIYFEIF
jgi:hypothetical protein